MTPIIGLTAFVETVQWGAWDRQVAMLTTTYLQGIAGAGGLPVLLPPSEVGAKDVVRRVDALVLTGGADIDPSRFGQTRHERTVVHEDRDRWELALTDAALDAGLPVLAICRGIQVLNVALGGSLHQHLPDVIGSEEHLRKPGTFGATKVRIDLASRVGQVVGAELTVPCHHHQAIDRLGQGLKAVGWSDDGVVEAAELEDHRFVVGVQWHPEQDLGDLRLFEALVEQVRER